MNSALTPSAIVAELDKYIVGQHAAKKAVAIALRNRWRRLQANPEMRQEIMPANILMIGATGVGKTEIARRLAQLADAPFVKVEASKFTEVGYVGRDVESMVRDLVEQSVGLVKQQRRAEVLDKAREQAEEHILDILIPPVKTPERAFSAPGFGGLVNESKTAFDPASASDAELNERTRDKFRQKLRNRELEERTIEIDVSVPAQNVQVMGPIGMEGMEGLQDMLSNMMPKKQKKRSLTVAQAREYLIEEEVQKLIDMDAVGRDAIERAENSGIIFIDEIDKVASRSAGKTGGPEVSREGVQRDLLPVVEGTVVSTKYGSIKTDHVLFIAAGAFHIAKPSDLIPELQGRFPIRVELSALQQADFVQILKHPRNALTKQYEALLAAEGIVLTFEPDSLEAIAEIAFTVNQEVENIGARRLHTIMSTLLDEILYAVPDQNTDKQFRITRAFVQQKVGAIAQKKDVSQYIL
jgi:ATP-dependent HslUV protease ATP-binding subunit HslU